MATKDINQHRLDRTGQRPLTFEGRELAKGASAINNADPDYSGRIGQATTATVYETRGGKLVLGVDDWTIWQGQSDRHTAYIYDDSEELLAALEHRVPDLVARNRLLAHLQESLDIAEHVD